GSKETGRLRRLIGWSLVEPRCLAYGAALRDQSKLHTAAHRVDAVCADPHFVPEVPCKLAGFCATAAAGSGRGLPAVAPAHGDDGVVALTQHAPRTGEFFERPDGQEAFH